jgi:hypothetical protein
MQIIISKQIIFEIYKGTNLIYTLMKGLFIHSNLYKLTQEMKQFVIVLNSH